MLSMILLTSGIKDNFAYLFFSSVFICTALEYFTSWLLEKLVGVKWWDYSAITKFNLNGRISLGSSLAFGIVSTLVTYYLHPQVKFFVSSLGNLLNPLAVALTCLLLLDVFASAYAVGRIKDSKALRKISGDQTNEIKRLTRAAIAQLITGKNFAEQKIAAAKKSAERQFLKTKKSAKRQFNKTKKNTQKKIRQTQKNFQKKQKEFKQKFNQLTS